MRTTINKEFERAFRPKYTFYPGFIADKINGTELKFPLAWLNPPDIIEVEHFIDGTRRLSCTLYLMQKDDNFDEARKAVCWQNMERDVFSAFDKMINDGKGIIESIENVKSEPNEYAYTGYSEIGVKFTFEMGVLYCDDYD